MGDAEFIAAPTNDQGAQGIFVKSKGRTSEHDIILYYVHGGDLASASVDFFLEYLVMLLMALQLQGFENPSIFALEYSNASTKSSGTVETGFYSQLTQVAIGWNYLSDSVSSNSNINSYAKPLLAACGDSNGATLTLSLMLHIAKPCPKVSVACTTKPSVVVLSSPITQYFEATSGSKSDYLTPKALIRYSKNIIIEPDDNPLDPYLNPGRCTSGVWWSEAFRGTYGIFISYGQSEMLAPQIKRFATLLNSCCRVKVESQPGQIHAWPVIMAYVGQSIDAREEGVNVLAQNLAQILLWEVESQVRL